MHPKHKILHEHHAADERFQFFTQGFSHADFLPDASGRKTSESFIRKDGDGQIERKTEPRSNERSSNKSIKIKQKGFKFNKKQSKRKTEKCTDRKHGINRHNMWNKIM